MQLNLFRHEPDRVPYQELEGYWQRLTGRNTKLSSKGRKWLSARWNEVASSRYYRDRFLTDTEVKLMKESRNQMLALWFKRYLDYCSRIRFVNGWEIDWLFRKKNFHDIVSGRYSSDIVAMEENDVLKDLC